MRIGEILQTPCCKVWNEMAIIIPSYNTKLSHMLDCMQSIQSQTVKPGIVILVNDFSDANETLMAYDMIVNLESGLNIKLLKPEHVTIGGGHAMNCGLDYAEAEGYTLARFMGSDDALMPECLQIHQYLFSHLDEALKSAEDMDTIGEKEFGGVQTFHIMYFEGKNRYSEQESASHPVFIIEKFRKAGMIFEEDKARNVDGPVLANFYSHYFMLTTTNYQGEIYRIHDNNMSHNVNGEWYGDISNNVKNDFKMTHHAIMKAKRTRRRMRK